MHTKLVILKLNNFKGLTGSFTFKGVNYRIIGDNGAGKTTYFDAFTWLLYDEDSTGRTNFEIKTLGEDNEPLHHLEHTVEATLTIDGETLVLRKTYMEKHRPKDGCDDQQELEGHTTHCYVDHVRVTRQEYNETVEKVVGKELFRLLTSPAGFNSLHWKNRRSLLMESFGTITDEDVVNARPDLAPVARLLGKSTLEKKENALKARLNILEEELKNLDTRLKEVHHNQEAATMDPKAHQAIIQQQAGLEAQIAALHQSLQHLGNNEEIRRLNHTLLQLEEEHSREHTQRLIRHNQELTAAMETADQHQQHHRQQEHQLKEIQHQLHTMAARTRDLQHQLSAFQHQLTATEGQSFNHDDNCTCPLCGQLIPQDRRQAAREEAQRQFHQHREETRRRITQQMAALEQELARHNTRQEALLHQQAQALFQQQGTAQAWHQAQAAVEAIKNRTRHQPPQMGEAPSPHPDIPRLEAALQHHKDRQQAQEAALRSQITALEGQRTQLLTHLAKYEAAEKAQARAAELGQLVTSHKEEKKRLQQQLKQLFDFNRAKINLLQQQVNQHFTMASFKLFKTQLNGNLVECCQTLYKGVPYDTNLNHGHRIQVGLDIINTFSRQYNICLPIFIDNRESITQLPATNAQVISLCVSGEDRELRAEPDHSIMPLHTSLTPEWNQWKGVHP